MSEELNIVRNIAAEEARKTTQELKTAILTELKNQANNHATPNPPTNNTVEVSGWKWAKQRTEQGWFITGNLPTVAVGLAVNAVPFTLGCLYHWIGTAVKKLMRKNP